MNQQLSETCRELTHIYFLVPELRIVGSQLKPVCGKWYLFTFEIVYTFELPGGNELKRLHCSFGPDRDKECPVDSGW
jgi:hypothetical protein